MSFNPYATVFGALFVGRLLWMVWHAAHLRPAPRCPFCGRRELRPPADRDPSRPCPLCELSDAEARRVEDEHFAADDWDQAFH